MTLRLLSRAKGRRAQTEAAMQLPPPAVMGMTGEVNEM